MAVAEPCAAEQVKAITRAMPPRRLRGEARLAKPCGAAEEIKRHRCVVERDRARAERERRLGAAGLEAERVGALRKRDA